MKLPDQADANNSRHIPEKIRQLVFKRDGYRCRYCGSKQRPFQADHVYPYSKGGETSIDNLVTACQKCNRAKWNRVGIWPRPIGYFDPKPKMKRYSMIGWLALAFGLGLSYIPYSEPTTHDSDFCDNTSYR